MPHINDLPATIIAHILYKAALTPAKRLSEWKEKLPLLAVCREWVKLAEFFVFDRIFVEVSEACTSFDTPIDESTHSAHVSWTSNAELIISRNCILKAKRLTIEMSSHTTLDHLKHIVLGILQLDHVDWLRINTLSITYPSLSCIHYAEPIDINEQTIADVARVMQYFGRNMRGIAELNLNNPAAKSTEDQVYTNLVSIYGGQLQVLRAWAPVPLVFSHFLRQIAVLELYLDSSAARVLPSVCGETLKVLKLDGVPRNFAWHHFRYDMFVRPIVFRRLTILHLSYNYSLKETTEDEIQSKTASGAHNCDQLVFPALTQLVIQKCTPDCDLLYADLPFAELETVRLVGSFDEISHCCRLKLTWVRDLHVEINLSRSEEATKVYAVTNHFFTNICIGRTAILEFNFQRFTLDPEHIRWVNLTMLGVISVNYVTICKVIARLPNLINFETNRLEFGTATVESLAADESLFISADPLLAWGEKLASIMITEFDVDCPLAVSACGIQALILNTGALTELSVPESLESLLNAFTIGYKDSSPHLANISIVYASPWCI
ncbi:hypothetical protein GGI19_004445 [Coemansia pectinata]|uniref:Uncharacterized protein n=1 Tax=Coemansia pectinata TaxID=1052879 RepID=A0A9W8GW82_9FUNG|nr:hypothetical protein GGI19_004445 [Coemansia pectinata]